MALTTTPTADLGWTCPEFELNDVFGKKHTLTKFLSDFDKSNSGQATSNKSNYDQKLNQTSLTSPITENPTNSKNKLFSNPFLIMFICNHCPYVKAIEDRLIELTYKLQKINIPVIAICSNTTDGSDISEYPEDSLENLKKRAIEKNYPFIYLHDNEQTVAKMLGAVCTPDFFLFDANKKLSYRGRLDNSWKDASMVTQTDLYFAALILADRMNELPVNIKNNISTALPFGFPTKPSMGCSIKWK